MIPLLLLVLAGLRLWQSGWSAPRAVPADTYRLISAAAFLAIVDSKIFREGIYFVVVAPVTAALAARLVSRNPCVGSERRDPSSPIGKSAPGSRFPMPVSALLSTTRWALTVILMSVTAVTSIAFARESEIFNPRRMLDTLRPTFQALFASPAIDGLQPAVTALRYEREAWLSGKLDELRVLLRYMHDCTRAGDRVLVSGSTPFQVGYYVGRPIAGGHLFWHDHWRSDSVHELQLLALLQRQSVPFLFSTTDPLLDDFRRYPRIREHLVAHYVELEGSEGRLFVDKRRQPSGRFGRLGFPCFG
jgi:hypothetical protein